MRPRILMLGFNRNVLQKFCFEINSKSHLLVQACFRHVGAQPPNDRRVRPLKVTSVSKRHDQTGDTQSRSSRAGNQWLLPDKEDEMEPLDIIANTISKYSSKHSAFKAEAEHKRELVQKMRFTKFKTIESNYFKKASPLNLLTWAAKEQIQYLHETSPKTWTVQTLSNLFPVTETDIRNIIKSKVRLHRDEDILQHDLTVQKNWNDLKAILKRQDSGTYDDDVCQAFRNFDNEIIITNAAGVDDLPFPVRKVEQFNPKGLFSAIVTDCYETKDKARKKADEKLRGQCGQLCEVLSEVSQIFDRMSQVNSSRVNTRVADVRIGLNVSETSYSQQLDNEDKHRNNQQDMEHFICPKYKHSSLPNHYDGSENVRRRVANRIQVVDHKTKAETSLSGDCVYDKNGQFLYRIL